jgi:hypothetical protein
VPIDGFWSYVHADDDAEGGRISRLARDVVAQYELLTGGSIDLFLDRDNLEWGDVWRRKIDDSILSIAFFIPVLTPRYFLSTECRRELNSFIRKSRELGLTELLMPILYVEFAALHQEPATDDLIALVKPFQWEDWTQLRFAPVHSGRYRRAVAKLAERLVRANLAAEEPTSAATPVLYEDSEGSETSDRLQATLEGMAIWMTTLSELTVQLNAIGDVFNAGTAQLDQSDSRNEVTTRIRILRHVASQLEVPVNEIDRLSQEYVRSLYDVDAGVSLAIAETPSTVESGEVSLADACAFFASIRSLAETAEDSLAITESMVSGTTAVESLSREIRPVIRRLRKSLTVMIEGRHVLRAWVALIDSSGLDCGNSTK